MLSTLLATVSGGGQFPLSSQSRFPPFRVTLPPTPTSSRCSAGWRASARFSRPVLRNAEQWFSKWTAASTLRGACQKFKGVGLIPSCCRGNGPRARAREPAPPYKVARRLTQCVPLMSLWQNCVVWTLLPSRRLGNIGPAHTALSEPRAALPDLCSPLRPPPLSPPSALTIQSTSSLSETFCLSLSRLLHILFLLLRIPFPGF